MRAEEADFPDRGTGDSLINFEPRGQLIDDSVTIFPMRSDKSPDDRLVAITRVFLQNGIPLRVAQVR